MKIATFNINNVNKRLDNLIVWLERTEPDVVCLQELKATDAEFPADAIKQAGYEANFEAPIVELNPAVHLFQELIVRKWEDYLDRQQLAPRR